MRNEVLGTHSVSALSLIIHDPFDDVTLDQAVGTLSPDHGDRLDAREAPVESSGGLLFLEHDEEAPLIGEGSIHGTRAISLPFGDLTDWLQSLLVKCKLSIDFVVDRRNPTGITSLSQQLNLHGEVMPSLELLSRSPK